MIEKGKNLAEEQVRNEIIGQEQIIKNRLKEISTIIEAGFKYSVEILENLDVRKTFEQLSSEILTQQSEIATKEKLTEIAQPLVTGGLIVNATLKKFPGSCARDFLIPFKTTDLSQIHRSWGGEATEFSQYDLNSANITGVYQEMYFQYIANGDFSGFRPVKEKGKIWCEITESGKKATIRKVKYGKKHVIENPTASDVKDTTALVYVTEFGDSYKEGRSYIWG
jgi:hypothetical protein